MNKRGAELTIGTLVIIVLAVIVLVVLVVGFTSGWGNLWANISAFFGGGVNLDTQVAACNTACLTKSTNAFCSQKRDVKASDNVFNKEKATDGTTISPTNELNDKACKDLATTYNNLGFQDCPDLCS